MSAKALNWAWNKVRGIKGSEKTVLARLADWANDEGYVWLGKEKIARDCCISKRTVDEAIKELDQKGLITISERYTEKGRRTSNLYQLQLNHAGQDDLFRGADSAGVQNSQGCKSRKTGVQISQGEGANLAPEPPIEPTTHPKEHSATAVAARATGGYRTKKGKILAGKALAQFEYFWNEFHQGWDKRGKAEAGDAWYSLSNGQEIPPRAWARVIAGAKAEAQARPGLIARGLTPKMAEGWLSGRRWEDYEPRQEEGRPAPPPPPAPPWFETCDGVIGKAQAFGMEINRESDFGEILDFVIDRIEEDGGNVPAELVEWRDLVRAAA